MSGPDTCEHGTDVSRRCDECEAEGAAWRARVQAGEEDCPICEQNCGRLGAQVEEMRRVVRGVYKIMASIEDEPVQDKDPAMSRQQGRFQVLDRLCSLVSGTKESE